MQITEIKVFPVQEDKLKAFVSVVLDECFMVNDIKVIKGRDGFFISMPSRRKKNGKFKDVAHPLNNETRRMMEEKILGEYERVVGSREAPVERRPAETTPSESPVSAPPRPPSPEMPAAAAAGTAGMDETEPPPAPGPPSSEQPEGDKSLEEVTEHHLRDSFWTT